MTEILLKWAIQWFENSICAEHGPECEDCKANRIALAALRAQLARENPQPLTLDELRERDGKPVWVKGQWGNDGEWVIVSFYASEMHGTCLSVRDGVGYGVGYSVGYPFAYYGNKWLVYDYPPKEAAR